VTKEKTCRTCDLTLPETRRYFYLRSEQIRADGSDWYDSECIACAIDRRKKSYYRRKDERAKAQSEGAV
jgi:hypothetical protein